jgi:hypothetical protein
MNLDLQKFLAATALLATTTAVACTCEPEQAKKTPPAATKADGDAGKADTKAEPKAADPKAAEPAKAEPAAVEAPPAPTPEDDAKADGAKAGDPVEETPSW